MTDVLMIEAEKLVDTGWDAIDADDLALATASASEALSLSPLALDAWVILARVQEVPTVRIALLREAIREGRRQLAPAIKAYRQTDFWLDMKTRPYMRAAHFLAVELWARDLAGDREEAIGLVRHLLKINPNDNQGIRFLAYGWLPLSGMWDDWSRLLRRYRDEIRTETRYSLALDAFRRRDGAADAALVRAIETNGHVPAFLLNQKAPFAPLSDTAPYRSALEAQTYAAHAFQIWRLVPGAAEWLDKGMRGASDD